MKKISYWILVAAAAVSLSACKGPGERETAAAGTGQESMAPADLSEVHKAVKEAYKDQYIPSYAYDEQAVSDLFGIGGELYEECIAEGPMISAHVDTFVAVKAKEGKGGEVEKLLAAYRENLVSDTMQYPSNLSKIQASQVVRHGDYVFFVMLGTPDQEAEEKGEEAALESAKKNNQIAVDVIDGFF